MEARSLFRSEIAPFVSQFALLIGASFLGNVALQYFELIWVGRYLGIPGTILIVLSLLYSLRKRKIIQTGSPKTLLTLHETFTWLGCLMVIVHGGTYFNAVLPWLALVGMIINVLSGLVGQRLLVRSRRHMKEAEERYRQQGFSDKEIEKEVFWDTVAFDLMAQWRVLHFPISFIFAALSIGHIISILMFWEWR